MNRALYSAVGGLSSHQFKMDVVGNDIANVNTVGYKQSRASFQSAFTQVARTASANTPIGLFVGLGVQVSGTQTLFNQGAFQRTDINTDIGIAGSGWFITKNGDGNGPTATAPTSDSGFYTRAGNFVLDSERFIRTVDGKFIYGVGQDGAAGEFAAGTLSASFDNQALDLGGSYVDFSLNPLSVSAMEANTGITFNFSNPTNAADIITATNDGVFGAVRIPLYIGVSNFDTVANLVDVTFERVANYSFATDGAITVTSDQGTSRRIGYLSIAYFNNDSGLADVGSSYFNRTPASGDATFYQPQTGPAGATQAGTLELSNVDLASEFTEMIITQRGFDANARTITTSSEMLQTVINIGR
jgi:flagellar hook protein FlgE